MNLIMDAKLLADLVSFETITPNGDEAIDYCSDFLKNIGFNCQKLVFGNVTNLYAKLGNYPKNICFAGHIDVVPPLAGWKTDPFTLTEINGNLYGRGTNDMKGPLSAGLLAIADFLKSTNPDFSISVMLTSDEEVMTSDGMSNVVEFLKFRDEKITGCILCESCSPGKSGEYIKIGCRGSLNIDLTSTGHQCHVVNAALEGNHLHGFVELIRKLAKSKLDDGNDRYPPSDIELTSVDVGNQVRNIVPSRASAKFNVRFNDHWTFERLEDFIKNMLSPNVSVSFERFGCPFIGADESFITFLSEGILKAIGASPQVGVAGGNSDALSISRLTNVVEIGSPIRGAHIVNEFISIDDLEKLKKIYLEILQNFSGSVISPKTHDFS